MVPECRNSVGARSTPRRIDTDGARESAGICARDGNVIPSARITGPGTTRCRPVRQEWPAQQVPALQKPVRRVRRVRPVRARLLQVRHPAALCHSSASCTP